MITLKTLPQATAQEVFDQAAKHLLTQNIRCADHEGMCKYRLVLSDGKVLKCAAGCFIGDDEYNESLEGESWRMLVDIEGIEKTHSDLICSLQDIHDDYDVEYWKSRLACLADKLGLQFNIEKYKS